MLKNVNETLEKLDRFEKTADPDLKAFLMEVGWHLENLHLSKCVQDAIFHLGDKGYYNPSEELLERTTKALFYNKDMQEHQDEHAGRIVGNVLSDIRPQISYFLVPQRDVIVDYTLNTGDTFQCIMRIWDADFEKALKNTRDLLLRHGTDEDVKRIMGAYVSEREEDRKLKTSGKYTDLGDGYILPGYVISVVKRMPGEEEA